MPKLFDSDFREPPGDGCGDLTSDESRCGDVEYDEDGNRYVILCAACLGDD